jgi:SAM-dependent methyltransferase
MNPPATAPRQTEATIDDLACCLDCGTPLSGEPNCPGCARAYPTRDGILEAIDALSGRNRIAASFYDSPGWIKFRRWEQGFLIMVGGIRKARMEILRHVVDRVKPPRVLALEVGIGDGENLACLPAGWNVQGVDVARTRLEDCIRRHPIMAGRLAWAEAEKLPFADATFDASWSVGGFNYYRDHEATLREMRRVTKPGGPVVVADEIPSLPRAGLGHLVGVPSLDGWWLRGLGLDREFADVVLEFDIDLKSLSERVWPGAVRHRIWRGLGYCLVDHTSDS